MLKKHVLLMLLFFICTAALIAGGGAEKAAEDVEEGPTRVIFYLWDDPAYPPIIDAFNNSQDEVFVDAKWVSLNEYEAQISTLLAGGAEMDGYMQKRSTDIFAHYNNGYIAPVDELAAEFGFDLGEVADYRDAISIDGNTLAIPFRGASWYCYYNKVIFEKAGIPTPDTYVEKGEWTWDKFIEVSAQLKEALPELPYGSFMYTWGSANVIPALQNGIQFIDANGKVDINDSLINSYLYRKELEERGLIMPLTETKVTKTHYSKPFYNGETGMLLIGSWFPGHMLSGRDDGLLEGYEWGDYSLTRLPCDEATYRTFGNPTFSHIHSKSDKKEAMFKFLAWMGGPEGAKIVAGNGLLPAYITDEVKAELSRILPDETAVKYYTEAKTVNPQFYNKYGSAVESELAAVMEEYLASDMSVSELRALLVKRLEQVAKQIQ
ncbi:ABC transporter substrate-binding protein [Marispirochaeta aestuarii]|uniref:ABC transporter substrate-binding protein n=1 Tax=Marispirochaeta aestuarii TaxID=1963862 RepID=UPI0029C7F551|nr:ABC transporter substrate-binding protein [Marispirochaeta aestuarii]